MAEERRTKSSGRGDRDRDNDRDGDGDGDGDDRGGRGGGRGAARRRRKMCRFCADTETGIDYKNPQMLKYFITDRGKMIPRRITGNCAKHQRKLAVAIKRSRMIALMPFTVTGR
jgi:small subunit ribosomal protein S18